MIRSALAILAGIAILLALAFAGDAIATPLLTLSFPNALPNPAAIPRNFWASLVVFAYSSLAVAAGGYFTAWLAPRLPLRHALIMGAIQALLVIPAMFDNPDLAPLWHWMVHLALAVPAAYAGGLARVKLRRS